MKIKFSISRKLLLFILPLVCFPIATVGYFSFHASVERVNRLVCHEQMVKVKATANEINDIFYYCRMDLETISSLPVLEDYYNARSFRLYAEAEFNYDNIVRLFGDFIARTPYYYQIRYIDERGNELIKVRSDGATKELLERSQQKFFKNARMSEPEKIYISGIVHSPFRKGFVIHWAKPVYSGWHEFAGVVVIDLDYEKIIEIINRIRVGERGYGFLIDKMGRTIAHPQCEPYAYDLENYNDASLKELVLEMMAGASKWGPYFFKGEENVAAFTPISNMGWSLAVTIPGVELRKEARAIQSRVIQVVVIALIIAVVGVSVLSHYLLQPVRNLVNATNRIASGDLTHEIPVQSRDELGDLTLSFNRMTRNLSHIQKELVRSEKLVSLGRLSAGVAHEIRNPLNAMKGAIVHLQRRRSNDTLIREYTGLVSEEIDRLNTVVTEFLYFAKQSAPKLIPTDFNKLIISTQNLFKKEAREKGITFDNQLGKELPLIFVDPHQMEQVLVNLLINAMDAMPEGGKITFSSFIKNGAGINRSADFMQIKVQDRGAGIPRKIRTYIFDPFFSTKDTGTGLGLPLSLGIVESHSGRIKVFSQEGLGTTVVIDLPLESNQIEKEPDIAEKEDIGGR